MKPIDFAKAFGLGVLIVALNLGLVFALGFLHDTVLEPGRTPAYYMTVYPKIAAFSAPIGAILMLFLATWRFGKRRPERSAPAFGGAVYASYFAVDVAMGLAMGPPSNLLVPPFFTSLAGGLLAVYAGATLARRGS